LKQIAYLIILLFCNGIAKAQSAFRFDFGTAKAAAGYIAVTPETNFNYQTGYGFTQNSEVESVDRGGDALTGDFITSKKPFYFSVKLPDGNYDVKLWLGDKKGISATTVRVENRRLMLENIRTKTGQMATGVFTVHVRDSLIRNNQGTVVSNVGIKPRERNYLHWDNMLTIEFNDSLPKICAMEITPNQSARTIFLAGNSTVVDQDREPWSAWGQMFPRFLVPSKVVVANYAESGETLKAFKRERRLEKIWSLAKRGDFLFIEFAHNDQKQGGNHLDPFTTYKETLKEWIDEARKRQVIPVLVTSMHRRNFDSSGHIINTLSDYPEAMRQVANETKVDLIDLNVLSKALYETWGPEKSLKAFVHFPANTFPNQKEELKDNTHFTPYGAYELAKCIVSEIRRKHLLLEMFIRNDVPPYDPLKPLPFEKFYWPQSSYMSSERPDGN